MTMMSIKNSYADGVKTMSCHSYDHVQHYSMYHTVAMLMTIVISNFNDIHVDISYLH
jgi:lantibiotic modifying enzyme